MKRCYSHIKILPISPLMLDFWSTEKSLNYYFYNWTDLKKKTTLLLAYFVGQICFGIGDFFPLFTYG